MAEPEGGGQDAGFLQRLGIGEPLEVIDDGQELVEDVPILSICAHDLLAEPPQGLQGIELGAAMRQRDQFDAQLGRGLTGLARGVAGSVVEQHQDGTVGLLRPQPGQKGTEVVGAVARAAAQISRAGPQVQGAKEHALGIVPTQAHGRLLTDGSPGCPQRRKQQQVRLVLHQEQRARCDVAQAAADALFFFARSPSGSST